ncbi:MAG TPA: hypothetical protein VNL77_06020 [Roseiflexaceae bacterium]|nr:hypothetical protein [Roseiflexaceae bacterium]
MAVLVDVATFQQMMDALARLDALDEAEAPGITALVKRVRAWRQAHPDEVTTDDSPEAVLAAGRDGYLRACLKSLPAGGGGCVRGKPLTLSVSNRR